LTLPKKKSKKEKKPPSIQTHKTNKKKKKKKEKEKEKKENTKCKINHILQEIVQRFTFSLHTTPRKNNK
jgi:uncharacterized FlaG/YvyC family protein